MFGGGSGAEMGMGLPGCRCYLLISTHLRESENKGQRDCFLESWENHMNTRDLVVGGGCCKGWGTWLGHCG